MNRLDRLTAILIQLQTKRVVNAQEIAHQFDISLRTVYRDIRSLETAGVPIIGEAGVGYKLVEGYRLPPVHFSKDEATAFLTAEKLVEGFTDAALQRQFKSAMLKIKSVLRLTEKDTLESLEQSIWVKQKQPTSNPSFLPHILQSIADREVLMIQYVGNATEPATQREIEPLGVYYQNEQWYLWAWCRLRNGERNFRLDRIQELRLTGQFFKVGSTNLRSYLAQNESTQGRLKATLLVEKEVNQYISAQKERYGFISEELQGDFIAMQFETPSYEYLARFMMQFADKIEAISPPELSDRFGRILERARKWTLQKN